ncbi:hypothetical protein [Agromyces sp. NPDC058104]|uniref:hypothetical protein n=1 Tax=Agromyces sp. NPDC058104 TaxID=3346342 RepID=UPI0036D78D7C
METIVDPTQGGVHQDPESVPLRTLEDRMAQIAAGPSSYSDPRCGCEEDGAGAKCDWDDLATLEHVYAVRMAAAA